MLYRIYLYGIIYISLMIEEAAFYSVFNQFF